MDKPRDSRWELLTKLQLSDPEHFFTADKDGLV